MSVQLKGSSVGLFVGLPVFILALRSIVDTLFRAVYPLWMRTQEGIKALGAMDQVCSPCGPCRRGEWCLAQRECAECMWSERG